VSLHVAPMRTGAHTAETSLLDWRNVVGVPSVSCVSPTVLSPYLGGERLRRCRQNADALPCAATSIASEARPVCSSSCSSHMVDDVKRAQMLFAVRLLQCFPSHLTPVATCPCP